MRGLQAEGTMVTLTGILVMMLAYAVLMNWKRRLYRAWFIGSVGCIVFGGIAGANEPDKPATMIISHGTGNYEKECPGIAFMGEGGRTLVVSADAYRCTRNGHTAFHTYETMQANKSELKPGGPVSGILHMGDVYWEIPWGYTAYIYRDRMFVFYRED
jgi:hypothetical protein